MSAGERWLTAVLLALSVLVAVVVLVTVVLAAVNFLGLFGVALVLVGMLTLVFASAL